MHKTSNNNTIEFNIYEAQLHNLYGGKLTQTQLTKVEKFRNSGLPPIISKGALSQFLGLSSEFIQNIVNDIPAQIS